MAYLTNIIFAICHARSLSVMYTFCTVYHVINISLILTVCELLHLVTLLSLTTHFLCFS